MPFKNARKTSVTRTGGTRRARATTTRTRQNKRTTRTARTGKSRSVGGKKTRRRKRTKRGGVNGMPPSTPHVARGPTAVAPRLVGKHAPSMVRVPDSALIASTPRPGSRSSAGVAPYMTPVNHSSRTAVDTEGHGIVPVNLDF